MSFLDAIKVLPNPALWIYDIVTAFNYFIAETHDIAAFMARLVDSCPPWVRLILGFSICWSAILAIMSALKRL